MGLWDSNLRFNGLASVLNHHIMFKDCKSQNIVTRWCCLFNNNMNTLLDKIGVGFVVLEFIRQKLIIVENAFAQRQEGVDDGVEDETVSGGGHFFRLKKI